MVVYEHSISVFKVNFNNEIVDYMKSGTLSNLITNYTDFPTFFDQIAHKLGIVDTYTSPNIFSFIRDNIDVTTMGVKYGISKSPIKIIFL